jgi:hypothetical protein
MKRVQRNKWLVGGALVGALLLGGCSDSECTLSNTSYTCFQFYNQNGKTVSMTGTISVTAAGTDSVLINQESAPSQFQLPLSYTHEKDTFIVHYTERMIDSIFVTHANIPHFLSMDCGTGMYHTIEAVSSTHNAIDSLSIVNPNVDYETKENIKLYFTTTE